MESRIYRQMMALFFGVNPARVNSGSRSIKKGNKSLNKRKSQKVEKKKQNSAKNK